MANISKIGEKAKISTQVQLQVKKNNYWFLNINPFFITEKTEKNQT